MRKFKVIILDDHPVFLSGLRHLISEDPDIIITDTCISASEMLLSLSLNPADIALIDFSRPSDDMQIISLINELHEHYPHILLIAVGESLPHRQSAAQVKQLLYTYLCKSLPPRVYLKVLKAACRKVNDGNSGKIYGASAGITQKSCAHQNLSCKEKKIIEYLQAGFSVTQTAQRTHRSVKTVSSQKRNAMRKLGITHEKEIYGLNLQDI
ncbi:LuxR C-terminal-related transcriptional regulator [Pantoea sp. SGAir0184]